MIGTPSENEELDSWLESEESREYVKSFAKTDAIELKDLYPGTDLAGLDLLR